MFVNPESRLVVCAWPSRGLEAGIRAPALPWPGCRALPLWSVKGLGAREVVTWSQLLLLIPLMCCC